MTWPGCLRARLRHRREDILRAESHLDLELLPHHLVAEPAGQPRPGAAGADFPQLGRGQHGAEMRGDLGENIFSSPDWGKTAGVRRRAGKP